MDSSCAAFLGLRWPAFGFSTTFDDKTKTLLTAIFVSVFSQKSLFWSIVVMYSIDKENKNKLMFHQT